MSFPIHRPRRLRRTPALRALVRETRLTPDNLVLPLFVAPGSDVRRPMDAIPGATLLSGSPLAEEARAVADAGIPAVLLFGIPHADDKDDLATAAADPRGVIQCAVRTIRDAAPDLVVITDLCLCEFTRDGHCGIFHDGVIDNDRTLELLRAIAVSQADAGADAIAPSGMMDGTVAALRAVLDGAGHTDVLVMPYSAKFRSRFYGPFKHVTDSSPAESLHDTHQLDVANAREALREIRIDVAEGADAVIVKPALSSLDIIARARSTTPVPIAAYNVSGVHSMLVQAGGGDPDQTDALVLEALSCIRRAGADIIITYHARRIAPRLG